MRIDTNLGEDDSDAVKELADRKGLQKTETYTRAIRTGVQVEKRRECIKELIVRFMQDEHDRYKDRIAVLKDQYGIDDVEHVDETQFAIIRDGDRYDFSAPHELVAVNDESVHGSICPDCGSDDLAFNVDNIDRDEPNYECGDCGHEFDKADRKGVPDMDAAEEVEEFARRRQELFEYIVSQLVNLLDGVMGRYSDYSTGEWLGPGLYQYNNGFQTVTIPFWAKETDRINFQVDQYIAGYESLRNPLYRAARQQLTDDYLDLVREVRAVNQDAGRVAPIFLDRRGNLPEVIEVTGLGYEETRRPLRTVGYEVEKVAPEPEELQPEHDEDATVTWIRVTNDKPIEQVEADSDE